MQSYLCVRLVEHDTLLLTPFPHGGLSISESAKQRRETFVKRTYRLLDGEHFPSDGT